MSEVVDVRADPQRARFIDEALTHLRTASYDRDDILQYFAFASRFASKAKGQLLQDLWALWESGGKVGGYFVEFGAGNGVSLSNSYFLEKEMSWSGIVAEPNPNFVASVRKARSCFVSDKCVYMQSGEKIAFITAPMGEYSRIASIVPEDKHELAGRRGNIEVMVETISLDDLLVEAKAPKRIDYMSIDTEGSELEILRSFDFDRWDVRSISVEHNMTPMRKEVFALLLRNGYRRKWPELTRFDDWYVRREA